ncbi:hypothetical protein ACQ4LE_005020 [Meloidogyne hapla]
MFSKILSFKDGDILFKLNFTFDETLKMNAGFTSQAFLRVERYTRHSEFRTQEWYKNPIGQTGVPIVVLIYADKDFFRIIINEGADHIILNYDTLPPWAANYVMITGNIYDIAFDDDEKNTTRCQNLFNKYNISGLPSNIFTFDERLKIGGKIIIDGRIPVGFNETIEINFLHGAIKQHEHIGTTVFQLKINKDKSCLNSYVKYYNITLWIYGLPGFCQPSAKFNEGERIILSIYPTIIRIPEYPHYANVIKSEIETEENLTELFYPTVIPLSATEYIEVNGFEAGFSFKHVSDKNG